MAPLTPVSEIIDALRTIRQEAEECFAGLEGSVCTEALGKRSRLLLVRAKMVDQHIQAQVLVDRKRKALGDNLRVKHQKLLQVEIERAKRVQREAMEE